LDVRVRRADLAGLRAAVKERGLRVSRDSAAYRNLVFELDGFEVDVEASIGPPGLCALPVEELVERAFRATEPLGFEHWQPELHDHALLLCVNVFKDKLIDARPEALRDLALLARHPAFVPSRFLDVVSRARARTLVWLVADWVVRTHGPNPWEAIRHAIGARPPRTVYARAFDWLAREARRGRALERVRGPALTLVARSASDTWPCRIEAFRAMAQFGVERMEVQWRKRVWQRHGE
jgi:hypothetical protein